MFHTLIPVSLIVILSAREATQPPLMLTNGIQPINEGVSIEPKGVLSNERSTKISGDFGHF